LADRTRILFLNSLHAAEILLSEPHRRLGLVHAGLRALNVFRTGDAHGLELRTCPVEVPVDIAQADLEIAGIDPRQQVALFNHVADIDRQGNQRPRHAEREVDLLGRLGPSRQAITVLDNLAADLDRAHRPDGIDLDNLLFASR
jgi:hypothetical protein